MMCISRLFLSFSLLGVACAAYAGVAPVVLSGPSPSIPSSLSVGDTQTVTYTLTSNIPGHSFPAVTITGSPSIPYADGAVSINTGSCGNNWTGSCTFTMSLAPTAAEEPTLSQVLNINYRGRSALSSSFSVAVTAPVSRNVFAYIANTFGGADGVLSCLQPGSTCTQAGWGLGTSQAYDVAVNAAGTFLYATDPFSSKIVSCNLNSTSGIVSGCTEQISLSGAASMAISPDGTMLYLAVPSGPSTGTVYACPVSGATVGSCAAVANQPSNATNNGIKVKTYAGTTYVYYGMSQNIERCSLATPTAFGSCTTQALPSNGQVSGMAFTPNGAYFYATKAAPPFNGTIYLCAVDGGGSLNACQTVVPVSSSTAERGIAVNPAGDALYITNGSNLYTCALTGGGSTVGSCNPPVDYSAYSTCLNGLEVR